MMKKMTQIYRRRRKEQNIIAKQSKLICLIIRFPNIDEDEANR